jgi:hypothetical protein
LITAFVGICRLLEFAEVPGQMIKASSRTAVRLSKGRLAFNGMILNAVLAI